MDELKNIENAVNEIAEEVTGKGKAQLGDAPKGVVTNCTTLRGDMMDCYNQLRIGKIGLREAKEIANLAGKIGTNAKIQMEYNAMVGKPDKKIDFFED